MSIENRVQNVFNEVFERDDFILTNDTTAEEVEEWDSLSHIQFIVGLENEFGVKFALGELQSLRNVGDAYNLINTKINN